MWAVYCVLYIYCTYVEYSCLLSFSISTWRWPFERPKHVVDLYVVNSIYISTTYKVVLDKDVHIILVYFRTQRGRRTLWKLCLSLITVSVILKYYSDIILSSAVVIIYFTVFPRKESFNITNSKQFWNSHCVIYWTFFWLYGWVPSHSAINFLESVFVSFRCPHQPNRNKLTRKRHWKASY